jgi:chorismate mutase/prephenate dehydratase
MPSSASIDGLRAAIDGIDGQIMELLNQRARIAQEIGKRKALDSAGGQAGRISEREAAIIERLKSINEGPLPSASVGAIFGEIFKACLGLQR